MSNNKQSSVEWLINIVVQDQLERDVPMVRWIEIFEQAKAMHKEEMKEMYLKGIGNYDPTFKRKDNETFGAKNDTQD